MNLAFNINLAEGYKSKSQIARILTENWVLNNSYCPSCGELPLMEFNNNLPVADFYCNKCSEEFELKSKGGKLTDIITDGAYSTMIKRIASDNNPNFFFLTYTKQWSVNNFLIIPKQFIVPEMIIQRPPLKETAKRAGWIGCNINISKVPESGRLFLVKDAQIANHTTIQESFRKTLFLREKYKDTRGWIIDIMNCVDSIKKESFTLDEVYKFEKKLKKKYTDNNHIKDKIRQQLQLLRDRNIIEFIGRGKYKKVSHI